MVKTILLSILLCVAAAMPALAQSDAIHHTLHFEDSLLSLSTQYNICVQDLRAANPVLANMEESVWFKSYTPLEEVVIPTNHTLCYESVQVESGVYGYEIPQRYNLDVCVEVIAHYNWNNRQPAYFMSNELAGQTISIPLDEPPCYNEAGQRLRYGEKQVNLRWLEKPYYDETPVYTVTASEIETLRKTDNIPDAEGVPFASLFQAKGWCSGVIYHENSFAFYITYSFEHHEPFLHPGLTLFVPDDMPHCTTINVSKGSTLYDVSLEYNTCMEDINRVQSWSKATLVAADDMQLEIPMDAEPCYDASNKRLHFDDKAVYEPKSGESLYDVAVQYKVCVSDLRDANPVLSGLEIWLPPILFIPDVPECDNTPPIRHVTYADESLQALSFMYNVCYNRIVEANTPTFFNAADEVNVIEKFPAGITLLIPTQRPDCYRMSPAGGINLIPYVCYPEPVDFDRDYTGYEPLMSPTVGTDSGHCYERTIIMTIIYNNEKLTLYHQRYQDNAVTIAQCFDIPLATLMDVNAQDYPSEVKPRYDTWIIPEPYNRDCYMLTEDNEAYERGYQAEMNRLGMIADDGLYRVNYGETLSEIGKRYGYLTQWLAAKNNIANPDLIYYRQELRLPNHINLYDLAKIAGAIGGIIGIPFALVTFYRWRTSGKRKRKNEDKTKVS
jgi:LysM repeat protein